jgi:hypothetical protein
VSSVGGTQSGHSLLKRVVDDHLVMTDSVVADRQSLAGNLGRETASLRADLREGRLDATALGVVEVVEVLDESVVELDTAQSELINISWRLVSFALMQTYRVVSLAENELGGFRQSHGRLVLVKSAVLSCGGVLVAGDDVLGNIVRIVVLMGLE